MALSGRLACGAALLGCIVLRAVQAHAEPLPSDQVTSVRIECRVPIDERNAERLVGLRPGDVWNPDAAPQIVSRLKDTQLFSEVAVEAIPAGEGLEVLVRLVRKPVISRIRFEGNDTLGNEQLRRVTRLQEGTAFSPAARDYAVEHVTDTYRQEGFEHAQVTASLFESAPGEVDVVFEILEGEPLTISGIEFAGDLALPEDELRKAARLAVGDRVQTKQKRDAERGVETLLRKAGYYEADVRSEWQPAAASARVLRFSIESGPHFDVVFEGNRELSEKELLGLIDLEKRVVVTDGTWRELSRRMRRAYQEQGFYEVKVGLGIDAETKTKTVRFAIDEGQKFLLVPIEFEGNERVPIEVLRAGMFSGPPGWIPWRRGALVDDVFEEDLKRLWYLVRRWGYLDGQIADYRIKADAETGRIQATVVIQAGAQTLVRKIDVRGFESVSMSPPASKLRIDEPLNAAALDADRESFETALRDAGYMDAAVTVDVASTPEGDVNGAAVTYTASPGARSRVGAVIVQNNFDTQSRVVRRELPFREGDPLSTNALLRGQSNVYRLGLFRSVTVEPAAAADKEGRRDVTVNVAERPPIGVQFGAGYNTRDGMRGFLELSDSNLQGRARRLSLRGDVALDPTQKSQPNEYLGNLGFREPRIFDSRWNVRFDLVAQRATRSIDQFSIEREAFIPAIERSILPGFVAGTDLQVEDARIFDVKPDVLAFNPRDEGRLHTTSFGPYFVYEGRDDAFSPKRGVFDSLRFRFAPGWLGSDIPLVKLQAHHSQYIPIWDDLTFVYAARAGWARTLDSGETVPLRERFFLGGRNTVRGFIENSVGPKGARIFNPYGGVVYEGGNPIGGDIAINLNAEVRVPLAFGVTGVVFTDGGGVYLHNLPILMSDFRRSAGVGLLYNTPVGPISVHYGIKLDKRSEEALGEADFSIGTSF